MALKRLKVKKSPKAFTPVAQAHNDLVSLLERMRGDERIDVKVTEGGILISMNPVAAGDGLPAGYTFREFTYCASGSPVTKWWPTWDTDPS